MQQFLEDAWQQQVDKHLENMSRNFPAHKWCDVMSPRLSVADAERYTSHVREDKGADPC